MPLKEIIPGFKYQNPAPVYFIPLSQNASDEETALKTVQLLSAADFSRVIQENTLVALKQHFGEAGNNNYITPPNTKAVVNWIKSNKGLPLLVETNTLYKGERSDSYRHLMLAYEHGFTYENVGAPVLILDGVHGQNQYPVPIPGKHFSNVYIVPDIPFFNSMVVLSHVKGHMLSGMGGALKNLGMGLSSRAGKLAQHDEFKPEFNRDKCTRCGLCTTFCPENALTLINESIQLDPDKCIGCGECYTACRYDAIGFNWAESDATFQEKMVEHALGAVVKHSEKVIYINFVNKLSKHCDCWGENNPVLYPDVGILASYDPVAIDRASYDLAQKVLDKDIFKELWPEIDATVQMKYGEKLGLGTCTYHLIDGNKNMR